MCSPTFFHLLYKTSCHVLMPGDDCAVSRNSSSTSLLPSAERLWQFAQHTAARCRHYCWTATPPAREMFGVCLIAVLFQKIALALLNCTENITNTNYLYGEFNQDAIPRIIRFPCVFLYLTDKFQLVFLILMKKKLKMTLNIVN